MEYCQFVGGALDGVVFRHANPQLLFPTSSFGRPGHAEDCETPTPTPKYHRQNIIVSPHKSVAVWNVYLCQSSEPPSPSQLMHAVLPRMLRVDSVPRLPDTDWERLVPMLPGDSLNPISSHSQDGATVFWYAIVNDHNVYRGRVRRTVLSINGVISDQLIVIYDTEGAPIKSMWDRAPLSREVAH